jgi:hypothetical protein
MLYNLGVDEEETLPPTIPPLILWAVAWQQTACRFRWNVFTNHYQTVHVPTHYSMKLDPSNANC